MTKKDDKFAVIRTGGKQYVVREGDKVKVEKISNDLKEGDKVVFDEVLLVSNGSDVKVGEPTVKGAKVEAKLLRNDRAKKISVIRFRAKSNNSFKNKGHRQHFSEVLIQSV